MADSRIPTSKSTITVVDDDRELVTIVHAILKDKGFNVRCAYSGPELFADLEEQKPDLIILDVMMPQMSGLEVLRRLKGAPETSAIPVILLTVLSFYTDMLIGYEVGANDYITKPFTKAQLVTRINRLLSRDQGHFVQSL